MSTSSTRSTRRCVASHSRSVATSSTRCASWTAWSARGRCEVSVSCYRSVRESSRCCSLQQTQTSGYRLVVLAPLCELLGPFATTTGLNATGASSAFKAPPQLFILTTYLACRRGHAPHVTAGAQARANARSSATARHSTTTSSGSSRSSNVECIVSSSSSGSVVIVRDGARLPS